MATVGNGPSEPSGSSSSPAGPSYFDKVNWEGGKFLNFYILDYCKKRGYHKTATQLIAEAHIPPGTRPPITAPQGLLFEWWAVFWILFTTRNNGVGPDEAHIYNKYQNQRASHVQRTDQVPPPVGSQSPARYPSTNGVPGTAPSLPASPNAALQNLSPTIVPSPQSQYGPQPPPASPIGPLSHSPHMNGPQHPQDPGSVDSAHPTPGPAYQQLIRPHSSHWHGASSRSHMTPHSSPPWSGHLPLGHERSYMDEALGSPDVKLISSPVGIVGEAELRAGFGDGGAQSLNAEKHAIRVEQGGPSNNGVGAPGANIHGPLLNCGPLAQPMQQQLSMQQERGSKRNITSFGEELPANDLSPGRKRPRRTPNPAEQEQRQAPQLPPQPRMAPMGSLPPGFMRGPAPIGRGQPLLIGLGGPTMNQMGLVPMTQTPATSPNMMHGPPGVINPQIQYTRQYRQEMVDVYKNNPNVPTLPVEHAGSQTHARSPGLPMGGRLPGQLGPQQPPNGMGGSMLPPGHTGTSGPPKPGGTGDEGDMNSRDRRTTGALIHNSPSTNSQRPASVSVPASAPVPTPPPLGRAVSMLDPRFDLSGMIANGGGDFDFPRWDVS